MSANHSFDVVGGDANAALDEDAECAAAAKDAIDTLVDQLVEDVRRDYDPFIYQWSHHYSGQSGSGRFNRDHHPVFSNPNWTIEHELEALRLLNRWNNDSCWKYWKMPGWFEPAVVTRKVGGR